VSNQGGFFSWHFGAGSDSFTNGWAEKVDEFTVGTIKNPAVPMYNTAGILCYLSREKARELLIEAGFTDISVDRVTRSYNNEAAIGENLDIQAQK
jgi:hypothetical protein